MLLRFEPRVRSSPDKQTMRAIVAIGPNSVSPVLSTGYLTHCSGSELEAITVCGAARHYSMPKLNPTLEPTPGGCDDPSGYYGAVPSTDGPIPRVG